ncbi:MAG: hypothetical protein HZB81_03795 [Deltaproteobacteria bacterium]|nr:hypothetical protein [Deltaproteobacteria bacterium]
MKYWFAYRVFDASVDQKPQSSVVRGPFDTYQKAKSEKMMLRGADIQKTAIFQAVSREDAEAIAENETYMIGG